MRGGRFARAGSHLAVFRYCRRMARFPVIGGADRRPAVEYVEGAVFRGYRPVAALGESVELIWTVAGLPAVPADRVLPNGVVEIIFNLGEPQRVIHGPGRYTRFRGAFVAGLQRGPLDIATEHGSYLVGIRFRPGGAAAVLGLPLSELTDQVVELSGGLAPGLSELREQLGLAGGDGERVALVEAALAARLARGPGGLGRAAAVNRWVARATRRLAGGALSVRELAADLGVSHKHLIDLFQREVGVGPKMLGRIFRLQRVLAALERGRGDRLTDLAYRCGYADQAHLSSEFRALTGIAPSAYGRARTVDPNHLASDAVRASASAAG